MPKLRMSRSMLGLVAERFKALSEPARLEILTLLREGEMTVSDIVARTKMSQANVSKHLRILDGLGFVSRRKEGLFSWYSLAGDDVLQLCDIMCGRITADTARLRRLLAS
jgi:DNA-binding transcriptional ArsR family regulator